MNRSDKPTAYIVVQAHTNSEWDACDFAIVHITEEWKNTMLQRLQLLAPFKKDDSFSSLVYSGSPVGFYTRPADVGPDFFAGMGNCCFIETTEEELQDLPALDNGLCGYQLWIDGLGFAAYKAFAEQTNDEFYTDGFNVAALIAAING